MVKINPIPHGLSAQNQSIFERGIALLKQAKKGGPQHREEFSEALECFRRLLNAAPFDYHAYLGLGYLFYQLYQDEMAEIFFKQVLVLDPHNQEARQVLNLMHARENENFKTEGLAAFASFYDALESILTVQIAHLETHLLNFKQRFSAKETHQLIHYRLEYAQVMYFYLKKGFEIVDSGLFGQELIQKIKVLEHLLTHYENLYRDSELAFLLKESLIRDSLLLQKYKNKLVKYARPAKPEKIKEFKARGLEHQKELRYLSSKGYDLSRINTLSVHYAQELQALESTSG